MKNTIKKGDVYRTFYINEHSVCHEGTWEVKKGTVLEKVKQSKCGEDMFQVGEKIDLKKCAFCKITEGGYEIRMVYPDKSGHLFYFGNITEEDEK